MAIDRERTFIYPGGASLKPMELFLGEIVIVCWMFL
jgi:hypothetical protein